MKLLIHCDEVFDILTRGPFPAGHESDGAVEHHLRCCHDCRQLAEALRPAVAMFHECLSAEEVASLPEYHGNVTPLTQPLARRLPRDIAEVQLPHEFASPQKRAAAERWPLLVQGIVGMALTAALVLMVVSLGSSLRNAQRPPALRGNNGTAIARPINSNQDAARHLLALQLPAACWLGNDFSSAGSMRTIEQQVASALEQREVACCTRCHAESKPHSPPLQQISTLQKSCLACHKG